jgi:anaerobic dimethyl sulfoxide reductase subunit B (iron-sulfur subunit)
MKPAVPEPRAFWFDASACSGCKACVVACKDKNELEVGRNWRRVSEVSGGTWTQEGGAWRNDVFAHYLSIACNHCDAPICLEGCPARAISRRNDGVVLLDSSRCLGCGYCSWLCPYSAPQLNVAQGTMSKCDFCVDLSDAGGEPACVSACPVRALDAGPLSELAKRHEIRENSRLSPQHWAPLPEPGLTQPQLLVTPHAASARIHTGPSELRPRPADGLREHSLVVFTVLSQAAAGALICAAPLRLLFPEQNLDEKILPAALLLMLAAMLASTLHLGRPSRSWRAFLNLASSWLSREVLLATLFVLMLASGTWLPNSLACAWASSALGLGYLVGMVRVYRQRTVPPWDARSTTVGFVSMALVLGALLAHWAYWMQDPGRFAAWSAALFVGAIGLSLRYRMRFYARYARVGV